MKKTLLWLCACALAATLCACALPIAARETAAPEDPQDAIARYKELRTRLHTVEKAQLNDVAHNTRDEEIAAMAQEQLILLCLHDEETSVCEAVLEMRGFEDPVVTVREDSVNVLVRAAALTQQESAVILELICRETHVDPANVKIIPIN